MTTSAGLYRYDIHDVVRCVDFEGACPVLEFLHKGAHFASMTGEKLSEHQVVRAVQGALDERGIKLEHFTMVPIPGDPAQYVLLVESALEASALEKLAASVDRHLCQANFEYEDRLASNRLAALEIHPVPTGTWDALRDRKISRRGGSTEQYKHPFLASSPDFLQQLPQLATVAQRAAANARQSSP